jgi:hypothetical protein
LPLTSQGVTTISLSFASAFGIDIEFHLRWNQKGVSPISLLSADRNNIFVINSKLKLLTYF